MRPTRPIDVAPATFDEDDAPRELVAWPEAVDEWRRIMPLLKHIVSDGDRAVVLAYCSQWALYTTAAREIACNGAVVKGSRGRVRHSPYLGVLNKALGQLLKIWPELQMTPASRARSGASQAIDRDDPFAEFDEPPVPGKRTQ